MGDQSKILTHYFYFWVFFLQLILCFCLFLCVYTVKISLVNVEEEGALI